MLLLISYPSKLKGEIPFLLRLFEEGLCYFHLRKPGYSEKEMVAYIESIPEEFCNRIVLHSHYHLVKKFGLKGIQLNQEKLAMLNEKYDHKGMSCHFPDELKTLDSSFAYAFLSPVFDSISKEGYNTAFSLKDLKDFFLANKLNTKVIALGGICSDNIHLAIETGFDGVALLGNIWIPFSEANEDQAFNNFLTAKGILEKHFNQAV